jgi:hypothetical protein
MTKHSTIINLSGCRPTSMPWSLAFRATALSRDAPRRPVAVAAGTIQVSDTSYSITGGNATITAADGTNPRIDLVCAKTDDTLPVTAGTPAANPKAPDIPASQVLIAMVYVPAADTDIDSNQITDKRVIAQVVTSTSDAAGTPSTILAGDASGDISLRRLTVDDRIIHDGDADTYIEFTADQADLVIGGNTTLSSLPNEMTVEGLFTHPTAYPLTVKGKGANETSPAVQLFVQNTAEEAVAVEDYENEVHIRLQAGSSANHRRYINFADYNGVDKWLIGATASQEFILYNSTTVHRLWFDETGNSYVNSANAQAVYINFHSTDTVGTGGFIVHTGGAPASNIQIFAIGQASGADSQLTMNVNSGTSATQHSVINLKDQGTTKFHIRKSNLNDLDIYDYGASRYVMLWDTSTARLSIGHNNPSTIASLVHAEETDAVTNAITNILALGHESSGTPAAGFGSGVLFLSESATVSKRSLGRLNYEWITATDASRAGGGRLTAYYTTTEQEAIAWDGDTGGIKLGFYAATPVAQHTATGETTGFTAGSGTAVNDDSTFTGNVGSTAYRISDIVQALKNLGLVAS